MNREEIEETRLRGETARAKKAFLDYLQLGPARSIRQLVEMYRDPDIYNQEPGNPDSPPTRQAKRIQLWSAAFNWQSRVNKVRDDQINKMLEEQNKHLAESLQFKYASVANRIDVLNEMAELLVDHARATNLQTKIIKQVGSGKNVKMVEEVQTDALTITAIRGLLSDLAAETGARVKTMKVRTPDGPLVDRRTIFILPSAGQGPQLPQPFEEGNYEVFDTQAREEPIPVDLPEPAELDQVEDGSDGHPDSS